MIPWVLLAQAVHEPGAHEGAEKAVEGAAEHHEGIAEILMHHVVNQHYGDLYLFGLNVGPSKHLLWFAIAAALVLVVVRLAIRSYRNHVPSGLGTAVETLVVYVRDEIAEKNIGHDGRKYVPLLLSFFFFILVAALLGLTPFSSTATGNLSVTLGLAFVSFLAMQWAGISKYGLVHHFQNMIPPGLPLWLLPIMIPVELLAMFTRPFALMIRLFANMLAGHMVIASLLLLIPLMASINFAFGVGMVPISLVLALFIMMLEILVAFIQAYIFTLLTSIFIGMNAHPAH
ncbi:MAG TPA: F0F1 ATP synthase subunit A [Vicinamibacteria bacterium]|nr:F0F1 ATP synthase subunit A [Vicinamibacteria bacterium]